MPTFVADEIVTAAKLNLGTARDWATWAPSYTNLTPGSGAVTVARYVEIGKTVVCYYHLTLGTGLSVGTGPTFSLPIAASANYASPIDLLGPAHLIDEGSQAYFGVVRTASATTITIQVYEAASTYTRTAGITSTIPFTWIAGDKIAFLATYEAA